MEQIKSSENYEIFDFFYDKVKSLNINDIVAVHEVAELIYMFNTGILINAYSEHVENFGKYAEKNAKDFLNTLIYARDKNFSPMEYWERVLVSEYGVDDILRIISNNKQDLIEMNRKAEQRKERCEFIIKKWLAPRFKKGISI